MKLWYAIQIMQFVHVGTSASWRTGTKYMCTWVPYTLAKLAIFYCILHFGY